MFSLKMDRQAVADDPTWRNVTDSMTQLLRNEAETMLRNYMDTVLTPHLKKMMIDYAAGLAFKVERMPPTSGAFSPKVDITLIMPETKQETKTV